MRKTRDEGKKNKSKIKIEKKIKNRNVEKTKAKQGPHGRVFVTS